MTTPVFTVFTATYDRAHTLERVYRSLVAQTFGSFEWLIVDDGSSDGTEALVERFVRERTIDIRYHRQPNMGKHVAFNRGVACARGGLFLNFDSDDECAPNALEVFHRTWLDIPDGERDAYTGVTCLCHDESGRIVGDEFPSDPFDSNSLEFSFNLNIRGEKWGFHRTDILKRFPFPARAGVKFLPEDIVWIPIGAEYKTRFINAALRLYHMDSGNQLTKERLAEQAVAKADYYDLIVSRYSRRMRRSSFKVKAYLNLVRFRLLSGQKPLPEWSATLDWRDRALLIAAIPVGAMLAARDR